MSASPAASRKLHNGPEAARRLRRRHAREMRFRIYGMMAVAVALLALGWLLFTMLSTGLTVFRQHFVTLEVELKEELIDPEGARDMAAIRRRDYKPLLLDAILRRLPETRAAWERIDRLYRSNEAHAERLREIAESRAAERAALVNELLQLVERDAAVNRLRELVLDDTDRIGTVEPVALPASPLLAAYARSRSGGRLTEAQRKIASGLMHRNRITLEADGSAVASVEVDFAAHIVDPRGREEEDEIERADFARLLARSLAPYDIRVASAFFALEDEALRAERERADALAAMRKLRRERIEMRDRILGMVSESGAESRLRALVQAQPDLIGRTVKIEAPVSDDLDQFLKGRIQADITEDLRTVKDDQIRWAQTLKEDGDIRARFNSIFFTHADSQDPELAGIASAFTGSLMALAVCFALSFPLGVAAAIWLEEFAPRNGWTDLIEVNINNLAAVPSIIFGLLGLAVFINLFGLPRSAPLVGGMVLALMTLPTIIIASRASLKAVPPSIREAALGIGASRVQTVFHHVLPLAMPGILTGSIIGMAQALGETAPLLMIGMVAFVTEVPGGLTEPAPALPVQIFMWADRPQAGFAERASGAILVLLSVLFIVNILAILARRRFERRW